MKKNNPRRRYAFGSCLIPAILFDHAPSEKVQELRDRLAELEHQIETLNTNYEVLDLYGI